MVKVKDTKVKIMIVKLHNSEDHNQSNKMPKVHKMNHLFHKEKTPTMMKESKLTQNTLDQKCQTENQKLYNKKKITLKDNFKNKMKMPLKLKQKVWMQVKKKNLLNNNTEKIPCSIKMKACNKELHQIFLIAKIMIVNILVWITEEEEDS